MSENIVLTTGIYDLIKEHLRRRKTTLQEEQILLDQLKSAQQVLRKELPTDVVTINCEVNVKDVETNEEQKYLLVDASKEKVKKGKYSILSPIGLAMVGNKIGDVIEWPFEEGAKKLEILSVVHQN
ncbi:GreA/GreB family elongation factor [Kaistella antarctica]|uniref:Elongation factor GreAB n=1 Tax=Kaistella antarctica TaxID=266748 RepID=A0A448NPJ1_9FLAO|nr:GreA/GreB family elongation factor [Kaistella antarctica]KEY19458.1 elongation factor GreAB [Kaistella antarctica]SEW07239.1 regulator of nucleoside diphosphate kinase [Kaistella antarctica]VEH97431.1 Regulator of nucleoside diphosphate kinase [Kaistella antarctica]